MFIRDLYYRKRSCDIHHCQLSSTEWCKLHNFIWGINHFNDRQFVDSEILVYLEKNVSEQGREPTTNATHVWHWHWDLDPGQLGGRRVLSPLHHSCSPTRNNLIVVHVCCCFNISGSVQTLFVFSQVFAIVREVDNPQLFTLEFVRGTTKKFMSTDRYIKGNES